MRRFLAVALAGLMATYGSSAQAALSITFHPGDMTIPADATVYQSFSGDPHVDDVGTPYVPAAHPNPAITETVVGTVNTYAVDNDAEGKGPNPGNPPFASILANSAYTIAFNTPIHLFTFLLGPLDQYNTVTLFLTNNTSIILNGKEIIGQAEPGLNAPYYGDTGRVSYYLTAADPAISSVMFSSTSNSFEIDELASATPEPAVWLLMIGGFGFAGASLRSRRRKLASA